MPHTPGLEERLPVGRTCSPGPSWQPATWAGPQQSQTHRGPHRRGVAAGWRRAAHCDQSHGVRPGATGPALGTEPSHSHTDSPCPAGPGRRDQSHQGLAPPRGRPLKGQIPVQPGLRSWHRAAAAPPLPSPRVLPASPPPHKHVRGGAGGGAQVRGTATSRVGAGRFIPSSQEAPLPQSSLPRPVKSPGLCFGPQRLLPSRGGSQGTQDWEHRS